MDKKQLSEEDVKRLFITPAIEAQWNKDHIRMEAKITDGRMNIKGNLAIRNTPKKADYLLYTASGHPIAVVEAKDNNHSVSFGMQQAKEYAAMMDLKFAYSSNGDAFQEYDFLTGQERTNLVLPSRHARGIQAFLQDEADEGGAFRRCTSMVAEPDRD